MSASDQAGTAVTPELLPASLEGHIVPPERLAIIRPLVARLSDAAREIAEELPFSADAADYVAVLESEPE